jgi:hypothetical protein
VVAAVDLTMLELLIQQVVLVALVVEHHQAMLLIGDLVEPVLLVKEMQVRQ